MATVSASPMLVFREPVVYRRLRRIVDIVVAVVALLALAPLIAAAAAAIRLEDRGPVFFAQRRVGRFGHSFMMFKLRTMRATACTDEHSPTRTRDARITRVGRWLRRYSIDELPQLLNVIRGEMSLVGPRPEMPFIVERYARWQHIRHIVTPGVTCIWQSECRSRIPLEHPEATALDVRYIATLSPATDLRILARTVVAVISARGAY